MTVKDELTGSSACGSYAETEYHVVETALQELEENLTGNTLFVACLFKEVMELLLKHSVGIFGFLLLTQLCAILGSLAALVGTVLARREIFLGENFIFAKNGFTEFAGDFGLGTGISSHFVFVYKLSGYQPGMPVSGNAAAITER